MKVILRSDVDNLGRAGDIKQVAAGYARNFLIPRKMAQLATPEAIQWYEKGAEKRAKLREKAASKAQETAGKLAGVHLSFSRQAGGEGKLFGSVGKSDIADSLKASGFTIDKKAIVMAAAIKEVGEHEIELKLAPEVSAKIKVSVVARA
ncbi:MAG: 50S ribosomal protein L9 [Elusimicrobia bacterium]|nr:50S ribosomal protein L9 [Elusimicrobiota bacterium]